MHLDCIVHDGVPHVIELNPRIAGSFICDIVRDGYGFNVVEALLDKLDGRPVDIPALFEPHAYARAEFLLDSDPGAWRFAQAGEIHDGTVTISYGPQVLPDRERRAFLYVRVALPVAHGVTVRPRIPVRRPTEMPSRSPPFQAHRETIGTPSGRPKADAPRGFGQAPSQTTPQQLPRPPFHVEG